MDRIFGTHSHGSSEPGLPGLKVEEHGGYAKVLVVDDEPYIVEEVIEQLKEDGIECLSAQSAQSALEIVKSDPQINIVVTDIRMPGMDGLEMSRQMKTSLNGERDLYVIVVTGHAGMNEAIEALQIGAEDFLTKPLSPDHLLHSVRRAGEIVNHRQNERNFQKRLENEVKIKTAKLSETMNQLAKSNQIKDQFMATMGHELRTPLNAINGFAEFLKEKLKGIDDKSVDEYIDHIISSGSRLANTIENILEFSQSISGNRKLNRETLTLEDVFENVIGQNNEMAESKEISVDILILPDDQLLVADRLMVCKSLSCILNNAIKFSPHGAVVTLGATRDDKTGTVSMFVNDNGPGMSEYEIELAKQPLNQVDGSLARTAEGTGIGLSLAILLSELQSGNIEIKSNPGEGATVSIILPQNNKNSNKQI